MTIDARALLSRLPAFYRERDVATGGQLAALLAVIAEQGAVLEADIARLYDNWFIETCDEWLVPYIGDLLGVRGLYSVSGTKTFGQRAYVANTLRLRRRKGTLAVLEELAFDTTGFPARAEEFFQTLLTYQHVNHPRPGNVRPDLRAAAALERVGGPFDRSAHFAEVRRLPAGRYNIPNVGLYLWRLPAYPIGRAPATRLTELPGFYSFDPLGRSFAQNPLASGGMLFNRPRTETELTHLAQPINVPEPLSRRLLHDELTAIRQALTDGDEPPFSYFSPDDGPVFRIWLDGAEVPAENLVICNLTPLPGVAPEEWRRPSTSLTISSTKGGRPAVTFPKDAARFLVGVDPVLGRISLPDGKAATRVEVAYAYGFPGDIGGGPYDRRPALDSDEPSQGLLSSTDFDVVLRVPGDHATVAAALQAAKPGTRTLVRIGSNVVEKLPAALTLDLPGTSLGIEAENRLRAVLLGDITLKGNASTKLALSGLWLDGKLTLKGPLAALDIRHSSLTASGGGIARVGTGSELQLTLIRSVCGPVRSKAALGGLDARDSVFDASGGAALDLPDTLVTLARCTVFGSTRCGGLEASDCLFTQPLNVTRRQEGCVRFCYVPADSTSPRRYRCQPDLAMAGLSAPMAKAERVRVTPSFTSVEFGHAAYAQLGLSTAPEVRTGAENGAEMGVWNLLQQPQREANLRQALDEYLRFGLEAAAIFVT